MLWEFISQKFIPRIHQTISNIEVFYWSIRSKIFSLFKVVTFAGMDFPDLDQHVHFNQDDRDYICSLCQTFRSKRPAKVKDHLEAIHFAGQFIYTCHACNKTFSGKNAYAVHNSLKHSRKHE